MGNGLRGNGTENLSIKKDEMAKLKEKLELAVRQAVILQKFRNNIVITITTEGLRIELIEGEGSLFFESGSPVPTEAGKDLLSRLAVEIGKMPNKVTIEGHTDSRPLYGPGRLFQLGAFGGSRQRRPPPDADRGNGNRPGNPGPRLRR